MEPYLEPTIFAAVFIAMIAAGCVKGMIGLRSAADVNRDPRNRDGSAPGGSLYRRADPCDQRLPGNARRHVSDPISPILVLELTPLRRHVGRHGAAVRR